MNITRRAWMGATAAGAAVIGAPALAGEAPRRDPSRTAARFAVTSAGAHPYGPALEALKAYAEAELAAQGLPGMTLSVTDQRGFTAVLDLGGPPGRLFQIGSISKSFLALTVLSLADEGKIDLDAPVDRYLPDAPLPAEPITVAQVLSHTGGLPDGAPVFPRTPEARLWSGFPRGSKFSYSNTGYVLLGAMVERVSGMSHEAAIRAGVLDKLGLDAIASDISQTDRERFPLAWQPTDQSLAAELPGAALEAAPWNPEDSAAGSIGADAGTMAHYLRALMAIAAGRGAPVLSDASAKRFATGVIASDADFGPGSKYALGVAVQPVDGTPCLHHTGGMIAFTSSFHADPAAGVAAFASVNGRMGGYRPRQTTAYAIRLMRAARAGAALPAPPDPLGPSRIKDAAPLLGRFVAADGAAFTIGAGDDFPRFEAQGAVAPLMRAGGMLATSHPAFARHSLDAVREGAVVAGFWWGETLFARGAAARQPTVPDRLRELAGAYLNRDPWVGSATVLARGDTLFLEAGGPLVDRGAWWSLAPDTGGVERFRFEGMLNGRATRLNASGVDLIRITV
jgi:CubicO group peptidase (beta-lactamase class C family)